MLQTPEVFVRISEFLMSEAFARILQIFEVFKTSEVLSKGNIMSGKEENTLIQSLCGKSNKLFGGRSCEFYDHIHTECQLLREKKMHEFWEKCRSRPFEMMYESTKVHIQRFKRIYKRLPIDDKEDINFEEIVTRLRKYGLKENFNIVGWRRYMNLTVYREVKKYLAKKGWIPKEAQCGTCKYLPESPPYTCRKTGEVRNKGDQTCEEYAQKIPFIDENDDTNMFVSGSAGDITDAIDEKDLIAKVLKVLKERIEDSEPGSKKNSVHERQYETIINFLHLFSEEDISEKDAVKFRAKECKKDVKTIQRDLTAIREFLEKMSIEW